jgi:hypothetical protein
MKITIIVFSELFLCKHIANWWFFEMIYISWSAITQHNILYRYYVMMMTLQLTRVFSQTSTICAFGLWSESMWIKKIHNKHEFIEHVLHVVEFVSMFRQGMPAAKWLTIEKKKIFDTFRLTKFGPNCLEIY